MVAEKRMTKTRKKTIMVKISCFFNTTRFRRASDSDLRAYLPELKIEMRRNPRRRAKSVAKNMGNNRGMIERRSMIR